jgi:hypothetical protein
VRLVLGWRVGAAGDDRLHLVECFRVDNRRLDNLV